MIVSIIGCGNMGLVYGRSFLRYNIVKQDYLLLAEKNEARRDELRKLNIGEVTVTDDPAIFGADVVILAVKPQDFGELAPKLKGKFRAQAVIVSIMAGIQIAQLEEALGTTAIVRAMPNLGVEVGMGMTGFSAHLSVSLNQVRRVEHLLSTTGRTVFFEDESLLNGVTALSGSGPAYFFYIIRAMVDAGKAMGLSEVESVTLVKQTMLGSFHLINNAGKPYDELISSVASKGGTTEAALSVFQKRGLHEALIEGILRAEERAEELSH
ncbi:MAG: pyrroline-5-carboxylate reductase [Bacteroidia bacterium]